MSSCSSGHQQVQPEQLQQQMNSVSIPGHCSNGSCQSLAAPAFTFQLRSWQGPFPERACLQLHYPKGQERLTVNSTTHCCLTSGLRHGLDTLNIRVQRWPVLQKQLRNHRTEPETQRINYQLGACSWAGNMPVAHTQTFSSMVNTDQLHCF